VRFEAPARVRHLPRLRIRYQSWDLSVAYLVDPKDGSCIDTLYPQDKASNAKGLRRVIEPLSGPLPEPAPAADPVPALLRKLLSDYAQTGLPPAYIPKKEIEEEDAHDA